MAVASNMCKNLDIISLTINVVGITVLDQYISTCYCTSAGLNEGQFNDLRFSPSSLNTIMNNIILPSIKV
jgi:hypothetical protein